MDLRRLRVGEWILALSGAALLVSLFLTWYERDGEGVSGWEAFTVVDGVLAAVATTALAAALVTTTQQTSAVSISLESIIVVLGLAASILALVRVLDVPDLGSGYGTAAGAYVGLAGAVGIAAGSMAAIRDQRLPTAVGVEAETMPPPAGKGP